MKKSEIALLIIVVSIVAFGAYLTLNYFTGAASSEPVDVDTTERFGTEVVQPSDKIFYDGAINPTVKVTIGEQANKQPFTIDQ